jgi:hypothetical protein
MDEDQKQVGGRITGGASLGGRDGGAGHRLARLSRVLVLRRCARSTGAARGVALLW